jgi:hypothetical protein
VDRRGWAGKVVDFVNLHVKRERDIVAYQFKARIAQMMRNVVADTGIEIVKAQDVVAFAHEDVAQVRAKKAGPSGYQNSLAMPPLIFSLLCGCGWPAKLETQCASIRSLLHDEIGLSHRNP